MSEPYLRPCPFCGGKASLFKGFEYIAVFREKHFVEVKCAACNASTRRFGADEEEEARMAWNIRTSFETVFKVTEEIPNCTVHVLQNPVTGEESWGWMRNDDESCGWRRKE